MSKAHRQPRGWGVARLTNGVEVAGQARRTHQCQSAPAIFADAR
ncbi:MAG TPA: hypothetical protein VH593_03900 [Ktedonobacteraceae bacterium]